MDASALPIDYQTPPKHWIFSHFTFSPFTDFVAFFSYFILDYVDLSQFTDFVEYFISSHYTDFVEYFIFSHSIADYVDKIQ